MEVSKLIIPSNGEQVTVNIKDATARQFINNYDGISPSDVADKDATLTWGTKTEIATIGEQSIHVTLPSNPDTNAVTSVSGKTGVVTLDKSDVGLGNVTNDSQVKRSEMGVANGVATLDANGKVSTSQLPSYVDDVIEGYYHEGTFYEEAAHTTAITPETGKIYIDLSTNKSYRWGGSTMVEIAGGGSSGITQVNVGETSYTPSSGVVSLPAYPTALPANGGNAATVGNHTVGTDVPANAVFTDHTYSVMGASGSTHASGLVPDTPSTPGTVKFLREDGTWAQPEGGGTIDYVVVDENVPSIDSTIIAQALRKTAQSLTSAEKTQVLTNLGITVSTSEPTSADGSNGDIWLVYED